MIHFYENKANIRIFCGAKNLDAKNTILLKYRPSLSDEKIQEKREEFSRMYTYEDEKGKVNCLIGKWALSGQLRTLTPARLEEAIEGHAPANMNLHHVVPVAWGGTNDEQNLILINTRVHSFLHRKIYGLVNKKIKEHLENLGDKPQKPIYVLLPKLPRVVQNIYEIYDIFTPSERQQFFTEEQCRAFVRQEFQSLFIDQKNLSR